MHPDWLGSPQHVVGGAGLALIVVVFAGRRLALASWLVAALALGVTALVEILVELVEYPLLYTDDPHVGAYYDTLADMAATLAGAVIAVALATLLRGWIRPPSARH